VVFVQFPLFVHTFDVDKVYPEAQLAQTVDDKQTLQPAGQAPQVKLTDDTNPGPHWTQIDELLYTKHPVSELVPVTMAPLAKT